MVKFSGEVQDKPEKKAIDSAIKQSVALMHATGDSVSMRGVQIARNYLSGEIGHKEAISAIVKAHTESD